MQGVLLGPCVDAPAHDQQYPALQDHARLAVVGEGHLQGKTSSSPMRRSTSCGKWAAHHLNTTEGAAALRARWPPATARRHRVDGTGWGLHCTSVKVCTRSQNVVVVLADAVSPFITNRNADPFTLLV
jgi:hypothetical protein